VPQETLVAAPAAPLRPAAKRRPRRLEGLTAFALIAPLLALLAVFFGLSILASLGISFTDWNTLIPPHWIGLRNYLAILQDPTFVAALLNTVYYTAVTVPVSTALSLVLAVLLNSRIRLRSLFRTIYFLPVVTIPVASAVVWAYMYDPQHGLIDGVLSRLGIPGPAWLDSLSWALPAVMVVGIWGSLGYNIILYLAGLQAIPRSYYEAAQLDGAGPWQLFRYVTVPLISPTTFFVVVTSTIGGLQVFDTVYVMTNGGPGNATKTLVWSIYFNGFSSFRMGYAAAQAWILFLVIMLVTVAQLILQRRWVHYDE